MSFYADGYGYGASGTAVAYTPEYAYNGSNVFYQCASGLPPCANGSYDFSGVLGIPSGRGGDLYLSAGCGGQPEAGRVCNEGGSEGAWSLVRLWWANLLLSNEATPTAGSVGGTLLSPNAAGTAELTLNAADPGGPGVYLVVVQIDGKTVYSGTPNSNGGKCVPVGSSGGALMFDYSQPCPASESVDLPINTTTLADGQHTMKVVVQDAAGNSAVGYDGTISTKQPSNNSLGAHPGPGTTTANFASRHGCHTERDDGQPNGPAQSRRQAQDDSHLLAPRRCVSRAACSTGRAVRSRAQRWTCCSRSAARRPWRSSGTPAPVPMGRSQRWCPAAPAGRIEIAYRAFSTDASYAATAKIAEAVEAGVQLTVSPRRTGSEGTITLSGHVLGPVPAQGVAVELLVHYRGRWEPFRVPQTDSRGRFEVVYQFQGGVGRFPFRASVLGGQAGFPFAHGESRAVDVTTN